MSNQHKLMNVLNNLMKECDIDDAELSRKTGVPASSISRMRINEKTNPTASTLRPLAKFFNITVSQLLGDDEIDKDRISGSYNNIEYTQKRMPIIDWDAIGSWITDKNSIINNCKDWVSTEKKISDNSYCIKIISDSFGIVFRKGSKIIVDPDKGFVDGDFIMVINTNTQKSTIKKVLIDEDEVYIRSVNPELKKLIPLDNNIYTYAGLVIETRLATTDDKELIKKKSRILPILNKVLILNKI